MLPSVPVVATGSWESHYNISRQIMQLQLSLTVAITAKELPVLDTGKFNCNCRHYKHLPVGSKGQEFTFPVHMTLTYNVPVEIVYPVIFVYCIPCYGHFCLYRFQ